MPNKKIKSNFKNVNKLEKFNNLNGYKKAMIEYRKYLTISIILIIVISIILIIWCSIIINYLSKINSCNCYNEENKSNYSDIQYLIILETIIIVISIFFILLFSPYLYLYFIKNKSGGGMSSNPLKYIMSLLYIIVWGFFVYYVYKFSENVNVNCICTQSWIRYLLYIQSFFMLITILVVFFMLFH